MDTGYYIKNLNAEQKIYAGMSLDSSAQFEVQDIDKLSLLNDASFITDLQAGNAVMNDGTFTLPYDHAVSFLGIGEPTYRNFYSGLDHTDSSSLNNFLDVNVVVTDVSTGIQGPFYVMQSLTNRRELYNDSTNPLYIPDLTPILGEDGYLEDHADRINNLETIHAKAGWHNQEVQKSLYARPKDMLIYYGWLNSYNYSIHAWSNEKVAQDMARYCLLVFGDGIQNPDHGDYANTTVIIPRVKALNPECQIYGYVSADQTFSDFTTKVDQWGVIGGMDGIFIDEAGYDFGVTRAEFNQRVDYVHDRTSCNLCFANAWNTDNILGTANDPSFPNSTYNDTSAESNLAQNDWILLESFPLNTTSFTSTGGYESASSWATRGSKMQALRSTYNVNFSAAGIVNNDNTKGTELFNFGYISSLMWSLESFGTSDTNYGASSATVKYWDRPSLCGLEGLWDLNAAVQVDTGDSDVYHRYTECARLSLDFSTGAHESSIIKTAKKPYGSLYNKDGTTAQTSIGTTPVKLQWTYAGSSAGLEIDSANSRIIVSSSDVYDVFVQTSFSGSNSTTFRMHLRKDGTEVSGFSTKRKLGVGGDVGSGSFSNTDYFEAGNILEVYVSADSAGNNLTLVEGQFRIKQY